MVLGFGVLSQRREAMGIAYNPDPGSIIIHFSCDDVRILSLVTTASRGCTVWCTNWGRDSCLCELGCAWQLK